MYVYILRLVSNKYYVGRSDSIVKRILTHFKTRGSYWTKKYNPVSVVSIMENCNKYDEDKYTIHMMDKYGINNVRGGTFVQVNLPIEQIQIIAKMISNANDWCFICFNPSHYTYRCKNKKVKLSSDINRLLYRMIALLSEQTIDNMININVIHQVLYKVDRTIFNSINVDDVYKLSTKLDVPIHDDIYVNHYVFSFNVCTFLQNSVI